MSTHVPGFESFFRIFASFCIGQISHMQHKGIQYIVYLNPMLLLANFTIQNVAETLACWYLSECLSRAIQ